MSYLDVLLGGIKTIQNNGANLAAEPTLNIVGATSIVDDSANKRTTVTLGTGITQLSGDVTAGPGSGSVNAVVNKVNGASVPAAGSLTTGYVLQVTGPSALGYGPVPSATLTGDVNGSTSSNHVDTLTGPGTGVVTLPTATKIKQTQGGTIPAPTAETPIVIQPRDPAKAPYQIYLSGGLFNSTWDDTLAFGYNCDLLTLTEPAIYWRLEQDYEVTPGTHWFEYYIEYFSTNRATTFRPIYLNVNRSTNQGQLLISVPGTSGNVAFTNASGSVTYMQFLPAVGGPVLGNNIALWGYDSTAVNRNLIQVTSGDYALVGDFALPNSMIVRGGAGGGGLGGLIFEVGPTDKLDFYDSGNVQRLRLDTTTNTTPLLQAATTVTQFTVGTNKGGAALALQADAATTVQTLASTGTELANLSTPAAGTGPRLVGSSGRFEVVDSDGTVRIF